MSVIISFLATELKNMYTSNSEIEIRTENFVIYVECLVYQNTAVYINLYVRISVIISFLAPELKNTYNSNSEIEGR